MTVGDSVSLQLPGARAFDAPAVDDAARLRATVQTEFDFVWRSLRRLGVPGPLVDDAAQQVFVVFSNRIADVAPERERSFLFSVARRVASQTRRAAHASRRADEVDVAAAPDSAPNPEALVDRKRRREYLDSLLDQLVPDLRAVLILYEGEGLTMVEIADLLGLPAGTVASRLRRARERFEHLVRSSAHPEILCGGTL
jgi:RNA polymerase sigma-70 factor, ECF subfamily